MRHFIKISILVGLAVLSASCNKFLDAPTKSSMDESVIFSTPAYAKDAIAGVIQSFGETNSYRGRYYTHYGTNTDCEIQNLSSETNGDINEKETLSNYNTSPTNGQMNTGNDTYSKAFEGIERANIAIRGLRAYADLGNWELAQILGEMLTLRAVLYVDLLKGWGNVPARFSPVTPETATLPRSDRDVILKQLLIDLDSAANLVGWPNENTYTQTTEHINKAFVKGLRSRVALMAGGYSMHVGEREMRLSNDPDLSEEKMYAIAKQECLDVINSNTAQLQPTGAYSSSFEAWIRAMHTEAHVTGNEILWEIPFSVERGRVIYTWGILHEKVDKYTGQAKGGGIRPNPMLFYQYRKEDVRRDLTCIPYIWTADPAGAETVPKQKLRTPYEMCFGKHRYEWLNRRVTNINDDGLNFLYMRYANILLMAAEAVNFIDGPAAAAPYLEEVKMRAYEGNTSFVAGEMNAAKASKEAFFNAVVDERAKELAGEMYRKEDLIRWNLLDKKWELNKEQLEKWHNRTAGYYIIQGQPFNGYSREVYWKEIPGTEESIEKNKGITLDIKGIEWGDLAGKPDATYQTAVWRLQEDAPGRDFWNRLCVRPRPSLQPYWPIWQYAIDASDGKIVNDPVFN
ncbi:MAG: RagB/SusD family nutrient uptake outer membrane protein [Bacteroidales bacterium]|jgi:hypothetical protein|nr:RagB/SusD family nutrient uptake outer membrane protein [Bacteroidales bacterium]